jgi:hypothetical protein
MCDQQPGGWSDESGVIKDGMRQELPLWPESGHTDWGCRAVYIVKRAAAEQLGTRQCGVTDGPPWCVLGVGALP